MFTHKYEYTIKWIASPMARNDEKKDALFPGRLYIISLIQLISLQLAF